METSKLDKKKAQIHNRLALEAGDTLKKIRDDFPDSPAGMEYFYNRIGDKYSGKEPESKKTVIGTMCIQVPDELILAADAKPVRLCSGSFTYDQAGAEFMPSKSCALVKSTMGMLHLEGQEKNMKMVVVPTTCDQKKKSAEMLNEFGFPVYFLEMPTRKDSDISRHYWQNSVKEFAVALEKVTGKSITSGKLKKALTLTNQARYEFRRLHNLRKAKPSVIFGKDVFMITNTYFFDDIENWTNALKNLNDELELRVEKKEGVINEHTPRILFTGSPPIFPNLKIPILIEELGGVVVADEVCSSSRFLYDVPSFDEQGMYDILPAIADVYLKPCTCPCFVPNSERKDRILNLVESFDIDGVIYQAFSGCQLYEMEQKSLGNVLADKEIPMLYLESDYSPEDTGQLSTRMEAFIESIKIKRKAQKKAGK